MIQNRTGLLHAAVSELGESLVAGSQPRWGGHGEQGLPNFCFIPCGGFVSSDTNAASWEQPCDALQGSELWANPRAALQIPLHKAGEEGDRLGRGGGMRKQSQEYIWADGSETVQELREDIL